MSHTPGPWEISLREMLDGWVIVVDRDGGIVANVNTETGPNIPPLVSRKMPAGANAALIAAAPDLLTATEAWIAAMDKWLETGIPSTPDESKAIYEAAVAAVKKARGL